MQRIKTKEAKPTPTPMITKTSTRKSYRLENHRTASYQFGLNSNPEQQLPVGNREIRRSLGFVVIFTFTACLCCSPGGGGVFVGS